MKGEGYLLLYVWLYVHTYIHVHVFGFMSFEHVKNQWADFM